MAQTEFVFNERTGELERADMRTPPRRVRKPAPEAEAMAMPVPDAAKSRRGRRTSKLKSPEPFVPEPPTTLTVGEAWRPVLATVARKTRTCFAGLLPEQLERSERSMSIYDRLIAGETVPRVEITEALRSAERTTLAGWRPDHCILRSGEMREVSSLSYAESQDIAQGPGLECTAAILGGMVIERALAILVYATSNQMTSWRCAVERLNEHAKSEVGR